MIRRIHSSLSTFKEIEFREGLNLIVVDSEPGASEKQTRNSAGKTSIVELVHFLLGADANKDSLFRHPAIAHCTFSASLDIGGKTVAIERSGSKPGRLYPSEPAAQQLPITCSKERTTGRMYISNGDWKRVLGHCLFGLPLDSSGTDHARKHSPSFRSMYSYFARRRNSGGFMHPEKNSEKQQRYDYQIGLSYLLGTDWRIPWELDQVREGERALKELRKAAKGGKLAELVGSVAEIRPQVVRAEKQARKLREELSRFEVHQAFRQLSTEAAQANKKLRELSCEEVVLKETLTQLEQAIASEAPPSHDDISAMYEAAGVQLPGVSLRRLEEVEAFYESVVKNRQVHLKSQSSESHVRLAEVEASMAELDARRSAILRDLQGKGALDDFVALQGRLAEREAGAAALRERFKSAQLIEGEETKLASDRASIHRRLQQDHLDRGNQLVEAIESVVDLVDELYDDRQGSFVIEASENGPEFRIAIEGDRGGGISNMEIFCMDLGLARTIAKRMTGPRFLIHDSHLFDGVDTRQAARAIEMGARVCSEIGWQYIVTLNSDVFDSLPFADPSFIKAAILPVNLSDRTEEGGLFGFRFD